MTYPSESQICAAFYERAREDSEGKLTIALPQFQSAVAELFTPLKYRTAKEQAEGMSAWT